jgi:hypothetical protein
MDSFNFFQLKDEYFHEYFIRAQDYFDELETWGYYYGKWALCRCIIQGMNPETRDLAEYMSNGSLSYMGLDECWDFFRFMSNQCMQVESTIPSPKPIETSINSLESMVRDIPERIAESRITEHCEACSSFAHSTSSCPFDVHEREVEVALELNPLVLNTYMHDEEESTTFESDYDDGLDVKCDSSPIISLEDNAEESITMPEPTKCKESNESFHNDDEVCLEPPCISHTELSFSLTPDLLDENPSPMLNEESYYSEFIYNKSGKIGEYSNPFEVYFENLPLDLNWFHHIPSHEHFARTFDKLKRYLNAILFNFDLSLCYLCSCEMCSKKFDRLLRALTMSNLEHRRSS